MPPTPRPPVSLFSIAWDVEKFTFSMSVSAWVIAVIVLATIGLAAWRWRSGALTFRDFEIDQSEIGLGQNKLRFKPNLTDRQVAYAIWVELSTRKIGLPIDFEHDVVSEIYDSWFSFFTVTRELIKSVPVQQMRHRSTREIVHFSVEILNEGIRPHLTQWQARFRRWSEFQLEKKGDEVAVLIEPQTLQGQFPKYEELRADMERVNQNLIRYRQKMRELAFKE